MTNTARARVARQCLGLRVEYTNRDCPEIATGMSADGLVAGVMVTKHYLVDRDTLSMA